MHMHEYVHLHDISQWSEFATLVYYISFEATQIKVGGY